MDAGRNDARDPLPENGTIRDFVGFNPVSCTRRLVGMGQHAIALFKILSQEFCRHIIQPPHYEVGV
jgi:hypothetical protein